MTLLHGGQLPRFELDFQPSAAFRIELPPDLDYLDQQRRLTILIPADFPSVLPRVFIQPSAYQKWPHCERSGLLCLWPENNEPQASPIEQIVDMIFDRISYVLHLVHPSTDDVERQSEFESEWLSYWPPNNPKKYRGHRSVLMLDVPDGLSQLDAQLVIKPGRRERSERSKMAQWDQLVLVASDPLQMERWGAHFTRLDDPEAQAVAIYVPLTTPLPVGMPRTLVDIHSLLDDSASQLLSDTLNSASVKRTYVWVIFGATFEAGSAYVAVELKPHIERWPPRTGYRSAKETRNADKMRPVTWAPRAIDVMRADRAWLLDRAIDQKRLSLRTSRVLLVGCGSLGSLVGEALVRAGIGRITLVDPDQLEAANIGRHVLGVDSIGQYKTAALARHFERIIPDVEIIPVKRKLEDAARAEVDISSYDLVISTTADWRCEQFLLDSQFGVAVAPPLVCAWIEPYGVAGHAFLRRSKHENFRSLFTDKGHFHRRCSVWPAGTTVRNLPACQATFQPAGLLGIQPVANMVAQMALASLQSKIARGQLWTWWTSAAGTREFGGEISVESETLSENAINKIDWSRLADLHSKNDDPS
ncbi:ThiF family adenylyltransferase [Salinisphaera japonica]|uniref:ThiF family adenylyltransferase n=1 Tax=Salinisphaera japonica TaxID=1304270 RepID=UPI001614A83C|nr:ThiF family adenylyltransferase [Salinisphaera japonica]